MPHPSAMNAKTEDYGWDHLTPGSTDYIAPAILTKLREVGAKSVLDAGCGNGSIPGVLAGQGFTVHGIDGDTKGIAIARERYPGVAFSVASFADDGAALAGAPFDAVISTEVVEHLYAPHELIRFSWETLKPGGHLILTTPYHGYLKNLALAVTGRLDQHFTALWHGGHIKFWSRATLNQLCAEQGFVPHSFGGVGRVPYLWKSMVMTVQKPA